jgi:hypothetical protein
VTARDPYRAAGLSCNPFVLEESAELPPALWIDRGFPAAPAPGEKRVVQVIGPQGAGKTSLLMHWRHEQPGPYRHYPAGVGRFRPPPVAPIAYWDEADRIPRLLLTAALRWAARRRSTLVFGTHEDLSRSAERFGFTCETLVPGAISVEELHEWAARRIRAAALSGAEPALALDDEQAKRIVAAAGRSWRVAADRLHVWAAESVAERP